MNWKTEIAESQQQAREAVQRGERSAAMHTLCDALDLLHREEPGGSESVQAEVALRTDLANVYRQLGDARRAGAEYRSILSALETVDEGGLELPRIGTTVQLATLLMEGRRIEEARALAAQITENDLNSIPDGAGRVFISVDLGRVRGELARWEGRQEDAAAIWGAALNGLTSMMSVHPPAVIMYARQLLERAVQLDAMKVPTAAWRALYRDADALAAELGEFVNQNAQGAASQYVQLQLLEGECARRAGAMAHAEDALWKAIELDRSWRVVLPVLGTYGRLALATDEELAAGGLPRDEVRGGVEELRSHAMEAAGVAAESDVGSALAQMLDHWVALSLGSETGESIRAKIDRTSDAKSDARVASVRAVLHALIGVSVS